MVISLLLLLQSLRSINSLYYVRHQFLDVRHQFLDVRQNMVWFYSILLSGIFKNVRHHFLDVRHHFLDVRQIPVCFYSIFLPGIFKLFHLCYTVHLIPGSVWSQPVTRWRCKVKVGYRLAVSPYQGMPALTFF